MRSTFFAIVLSAVSFISFSQTGTNPDLLNENSVSLLKSFEVNDTVWHIDSTLRQYNTDSGFITRERTITVTYDQKGRVTSRVTQFLNAENLWINKSYDSTVFSNDTDIITERFTYTWNTGSGNWVNTSYNKLNNTGEQELYFYKQWDNISGKYTSGYQKRWEYDADGRLSMYFWDEFDKTVQDFKSKSRTNYLYNDSGQLTTKLYEQLNTQNQEWEQVSKSVLEYNEQGFLSLDSFFLWNAGAGQWEKLKKTEYSYNNSGQRDTTTYYDWLNDLQIWYPPLRVTYIYDEQSRKTEAITQESVPPGDLWFNVSRSLTVYEGDVVAENRSQKWGADGWKDDQIKLFTYVNDSLFESQTIIQYNTYDQVYDTLLRYFQEYNDRLFPSAFLFQDWDKTSGDFVTSMQILTFWSPLGSPASVQETNTLDFLVYPNPSDGHYNIFFPGEYQKDSKIIVYDASGRALGTYTLDKGKTALDLSNEPQGIYYIRLVSGKDQGIRKLVKF